MQGLQSVDLESSSTERSFPQTSVWLGGNGGSFYWAGSNSSRIVAATASRQSLLRSLLQFMP